MKTPGLMLLKFTIFYYIIFYIPVGFMNCCHKVMFVAKRLDAVQHGENVVGWLTLVFNTKFDNLPSQDNNLLSCKMIQLHVFSPEKM